MPEFPIVIKSVQESETRGEYAVEPLARGFGHTLGNSLRRVLLGQLSGAAVTRLKVNNLPHEFSPIPGVVEDVTELILNLKKVHFVLEDHKTAIVTLEASGEQEIHAGDLKLPANVSVVNPKVHIATLAGKDSKLNLTMTVEYGKGYRLPNSQEKRAVGELLLDADFSPVRQVNYRVENARVGRETNLDRLLIEVLTNGILSPMDALRQAAAILLEHFSILANGPGVKTDTDADASSTRGAKSAANQREVYLEELQIPTRVINTLKEVGIRTVEDVQKQGAEGLQGIKNIGPKTVQLIMEQVRKLEE